MPFIKKDPLETPNVCRHPEHEPPGMMALPNGKYTWQCPGCGATVSFVVDSPSLNTGDTESLQEMLLDQLRKAGADKQSPPKKPWGSDIPGYTPMNYRNPYDNHSGQVQVTL